jgi:hypothetical protein
MVTDAPYEWPEAALPPLVAGLAGAVGAVVMLAVALIWHPVVAYLRGVALVVVPAGWLGGEGAAVAVGLGVQITVGILLGLAYGSSQHRAPRAALLASGVAFGVLLWVGGRILSLWGSPPPVRQTVHSWTWLVSCVAYAQVLAAAAVVWQRFHPPAPRVVVKD